MCTWLFIHIKQQGKCLRSILYFITKIILGQCHVSGKLELASVYRSSWSCIMWCWLLLTFSFNKAGSFKFKQALGGCELLQKSIGAGSWQWHLQSQSANSRTENEGDTVQPSKLENRPNNMFFVMLKIVKLIESLLSLSGRGYGWSWSGGFAE